MRNILRYLYVVTFFLIFAGCEVPPPQPTVPEKNPFEGLKIDDLRDKSLDKTIGQSLMSFRVLTYTIVPAVRGQLHIVYDKLSQKDVRMVNPNAFSANGFFVGTGTLDQSRDVVKILTELGAVRNSQARLIIPDAPEIVSRTLLPVAKKITYSSGSTEADMMIEAGFAGWVLSPKPDPRFRGMAQITLYPAYWQQGIENIRLLMGKEPVEYKLFDECSVLARVEENGFVLLGPAREIPEQSTLDRLCFYLPDKRPKVQFFIIIYDSTGS